MFETKKKLNIFLFLIFDLFKKIVPSKKNVRMAEDSTVHYT